MTTESKKVIQRKRVLWTIAMVITVWIIIGFLFSSVTGGLFAGLFFGILFYLGTTPPENENDIFTD